MGAKAKELKSLSRADILELLLAQTERVEQLEKEIAEAKEKAESRDILIDKAGTLAEAALSINRVWQAADQAAAQYLENVLRLYDEQMAKLSNLEQECAEKRQSLMGITTDSFDAMEQETREKCEAMERATADKCRAMEQETRAKCQDMEKQTELTCRDMTQKAQEESQAYWDNVYTKLQEYCASRGELSALLQRKG